MLMVQKCTVPLMFQNLLHMFQTVLFELCVSEIIHSNDTPPKEYNQVVCKAIHSGDALLPKINFLGIFLQEL